MRFFPVKSAFTKLHLKSFPQLAILGYRNLAFQFHIQNKKAAKLYFLYFQQPIFIFLMLTSYETSFATKQNHKYKRIGRKKVTTSTLTIIESVTSTSCFLFDFCQFQNTIDKHNNFYYRKQKIMMQFETVNFSHKSGIDSSGI